MGRTKQVGAPGVVTFIRLDEATRVRVRALARAEARSLGAQLGVLVREALETRDHEAAVVVFPVGESATKSTS